MVNYRVSADQSHMVVSLIEIRCYLDFSADELLAFNWSQAQIYVFQVMWFSPKVKYRFLDFFAIALSPLSEVNLECIDGSFAFSSG